jgi:TolB protein
VGSCDREPGWQPIAEEKGAVSRDGIRFAYSLNQAGIQIKDLVSGGIASVPGTTGSYPDLFWTPDGRSIVFSQIGSFDLFMVNTDGSNLRQLTFGGYQEIPSGWLADGNLLYGEYEAEDQYVAYRLDLQSGESQEFSRGEDIQSISPDGRYLAIGKLTFGEHWQITIRESDGQNSWPLNDGDPSILLSRWSPDGQWIIVAVLKPGAGASMHALINLRTCDAIPLPHLQDDVLAWLP